VNTVQNCRTNHKLRKSILVEFEFFTPKCIKTVYFHLSKFVGETLTILSKVEPRKSMPIQKIMKKKTSKKHVKSLTRFTIVV